MFYRTYFLVRLTIAIAVPRTADSDGKTSWPSLAFFLPLLFTIKHPLTPFWQLFELDRGFVHLNLHSLTALRHIQCDVSACADAIHSRGWPISSGATLYRRKDMRKPNGYAQRPLMYTYRAKVYLWRKQLYFGGKYLKKYLSFNIQPMTYKLKGN